MGWSKEVGHDITDYDDQLVNDLKQNAVPADLFNQVLVLSSFACELDFDKFSNFHLLDDSLERIKHLSLNIFQ